MNGYEEAMKIDAKLNSMVENEPITGENAMEWLHFARTVKSTAKIIEEVAMDKQSEYTRNLATNRTNL